MMRVRELAGWGIDVDPYRAATYRGDPDHAQALVARRVPFENRTALIEHNEYRLRERLAAIAKRDDLCTEFAGLDWSLEVVDLRLLLAFQRRIVLDSEVPGSRIPNADDSDGLIELCFGGPKPLIVDAVRTATSVLFRSANPNLQVRITENSASPIAIHSGSPFFEVAEYRGRWFLRDGYHRAFGCLKAGVTHLPAVIVRASTLLEVGAIHPWFFPEEVLFSCSPPQVIDFLDDALVIEYNRSLLLKTLHITVEESYSLQGEGS